MSLHKELFIEEHDRIVEELIEKGYSASAARDLADERAYKSATDKIMDWIDNERKRAKSG